MLAVGDVPGGHLERLGGSVHDLLHGQMTGREAVREFSRVVAVTAADPQSICGHSRVGHCDRSVDDQHRHVVALAARIDHLGDATQIEAPGAEAVSPAKTPGRFRDHPEAMRMV
ncbi:MAG: hypothetical protein F4091_14960 [Acidimicrobiales bacterium]|nr:hypothetical protein [Acidimicrobiaceae bacterium]MYA25535.1 hypothetical protein [Acidimicrobiales bacterium]MCY3607880.1 hypothetical protein [Acidimicrobiaceae bacterium]MDE0676889.1 hypothetical protein [Acidimicrobiaceae bacterium]MYD83663.1 hypothetical protein [Acidimicrobiales bacterium]